jgi:hypothetical protein
MMKKAGFLGSDHLIGETVLNLSALSASTRVEEKTLTLTSHSSSQPIAELTVEMQLILSGVSLIADAMAAQFVSILENVGGGEVSGVSPVRMTENFNRFLIGVTPLVRARNYINDVYSWRSPSKSALACLVVFVFNLYKDYALLLLVLGLYIYMLRTHRTDAVPTKPDLGENLLFVQETMGMFSSSVEKLQQFIQEVLHWEKREVSLQFKEGLKLAIVPCAALCLCFSLLDLLMYGLIGSVLLSSHGIRYSLLVAVLKIYSSFTHRYSDSTLLPVEQTQPSDLRVYRVYENQRLWLRKWSNMMLPHERHNWSDVNGQPYDKDAVQLPQGFNWTDMWHIEGDWEYAVDFSKKFHPQPGFFDYVRRRCWVRSAEISRS